MGLIDLHTHSNFSDGSLTPSKLVLLAADSLVTVLALTDHDTILGLSEAFAASKQLAQEGRQVFIVPGVEISAAYKDRDIHILGLNIDADNHGLLSLLERSVNERNNRNERMAALFRDAGIPITTSKLQVKAGETTITRAHFANYLVKHGFCKNNREAFCRYLGYDSPFYLQRKYISPKEAIEGILGAGGVPVLAHPLLYKLSINSLSLLLAQLKEFGLQGIEVFYSANISNDESTAWQLANRFGLIMTGGSDFHGDCKPDIKIGTGRGNLRVPDLVRQNLPFYIP